MKKIVRINYKLAKPLSSDMVEQIENLAGEGISLFETAKLRSSDREWWINTTTLLATEVGHNRSNWKIILGFMIRDSERIQLEGIRSESQVLNARKKLVSIVYAIATIFGVVEILENF